MFFLGLLGSKPFSCVFRFLAVHSELVIYFIIDIHCMTFTKISQFLNFLQHIIYIIYIYIYIYINNKIIRHHTKAQDATNCVIVVKFVRLVFIQNCLDVC